MESVPGQIFIAIGAVIAALIAGAFSYFNLVSAKEAKVSEFRQAWIDALRTEITTYISRLLAVTTLGGYIHANLPEEEKYNIELIRERSRLSEEALSAYHSIHLRINKSESDPVAKELNDAFLDALVTAHAFYSIGDSESLDDNLMALSAAAGPLLKYEWDRVKDGEPSYRGAKRTALVIAVMATILLIFVSVGVFWMTKGKLSTVLSTSVVEQNALSASQKSKSKPLASVVPAPESLNPNPPHKATATDKSASEP